MKSSLTSMSSFGLAACLGLTAASAAAAAPNCSALTSSPVFQVINPGTGANLLTASQDEADTAIAYGYVDKGTLFQASLDTSTASADGLVGAHRMYNAKSKDFFWTISASEITSAVQRYGYVDQGISFYVSATAASCTQPVYRFLLGSMHRFAVSQQERDALTAGGWTYEGIMFHGGISDDSDSPPMPHGPLGNWTLKFDDEFNGNTLDANKWAPCWFDSGGDKCGSVQNDGVYTYKSNVRIENGNLILTLSAPTKGAAVTTNPKGGAKTGYQFTTGVVEARIFFPGDKNGVCYNWPAWWTDGQKWPDDGENDIAEVLNGQITFNYHSLSGAHNFNAIGARCGEWHIYTLNRQATYSEVYLDGRLVKRYATDDSRKPQYLILNVAYDKNHLLTGPDGAMRVDWVRAWQ